MKRIINFQKSEKDYQLVDGDSVLFAIDIAEMKFDVKEFYYAFFVDDEEIKNSEIKNTIPSDKDASRVYDCIVKLYKEIVEGFNKNNRNDKGEKE